MPAARWKTEGRLLEIAFPLERPNLQRLATAQTTMNECPFSGGEIEPLSARNWVNAVIPKPFAKNVPAFAHSIRLHAEPEHCCPCESRA